MRLLLLFLVFLSLGNSAKKTSNKFYDTVGVPRMRWTPEQTNEGNENTPYRHEIVMSGGVSIKVKKGSNYSIHPTGLCHDRKIALVVQLQQKKIWQDAGKMQEGTCTIVITIDDGQVEVWYGLCRGPLPANHRKFNFPLNPMNALYFTFNLFTMTMYKRDGDDGQDFEMGKIEHVPPKDPDSNYTAFDQFTAFLYHDSCDTVTLKTVYHKDDWRHTKKTAEKKHATEAYLFTRIIAIFSFIMSGACLIISTMYVWSKGVPFFTNRIYDRVFARFRKDSKVAQQQDKDAKSCNTAEGSSLEDKEDKDTEGIFGEKGRLLRLPPGWYIPDWNSPLVDDEEVDNGLLTAIDNVEEAPAGGQIVPDGQSNGQQPGGEPANATPTVQAPPAKPDQADKKAAAPDAKPAASIVV